jgi:hypothetical protein
MKDVSIPLEPDALPPGEYLLSEAGAPRLWVHGTRAVIEADALDPAATAEGGLHFGTETQARMRAGGRGKLVYAYLRAGNARRARDEGEKGWVGKVRAARAGGFSALRYLLQPHRCSSRIALAQGRHGSRPDAGECACSMHQAIPQGATCRRRPRGIESPALGRGAKRGAPGTGKWSRTACVLPSDSYCDKARW